MTDYHIHSEFSADSQQSIEQICQSAIKNNITEIAITDHIDLEYPYSGPAFDFDFQKRLESIKEYRLKFPMLKILNGLEVGLMPNTLKQNEEYIKDVDFDFIIASVHIINNVDPYFPEYFENRTKYEAYVEYLKQISFCLDGFEKYNVIGHIGYASRLCQEKDKIMNYFDYSDLIDEILKKVIAKGKGIEVNTKGIPSTGDTLPSKSIIERYKQLGGQIITIGSDAHVSDRVGADCAITAEYLKSIGFEYITRYNNMKPSFIKI